MTKPDDVQMKLRIPAEIHQRLTLTAAINYRSLNGEVNSILARYFALEMSPEETAIIEQAQEILARKIGG
jgi:plasmid stability protein